ncbi:MAG: phosphoribosylamine--glycine ligase [Actinomycetia bacterium]|nr:phosphoribosylamine--glycine ligase [Actinomycetes bacterium]
MGEGVLVVGAGAREHALVWALARSPEVDRVVATPGNAGMAGLAECVDLADDDAVVAYAAAEQLWVVVGPEAPLARGLADRLAAAGVRVVGPSRAAARIESSKADAKRVMRAAGIPTAEAVVVHGWREAEAALDRFPAGVVVKADGLAAGKGVTVCEDRTEAAAALRALLVDDALGPAGRTVVLEERLAGEEMSVMVVTDGTRFAYLPPARDYKRLGTGDVGPNTGGMGAVAPHPAWTPALADEVAARIIDPVLTQLRREGRPFRGVLYAGLMLTAEGPKVLEFNARFGDPEATVMLPLLEDDLFPWLVAAGGGPWPARAPRWTGAAVGVVLAAPGYPGRVATGIPITVEPGEGAVVFHAATVRDGAGRLVNGGGRSLVAVGLGSDPETARKRAYAQVERIRFEGAQWRRDIGETSRPGR